MADPIYNKGGIRLYHGDFHEVCAELPEASFEAIITDPPYPRTYLDLWEPLGAAGARLLRRGGSLLSIVPHYAMPYVLDEVGQWLKWRWLIAMEQDAGPHARMAMGIEVCWKPVGWWVKGSWPARRGFKRDQFSSIDVLEDLPRSNGKLHKWQQSLGWARSMLRFVPPGQPVLDPMVGSGTLLLAAREAGYPAVGIDNDESACQIAIDRLCSEV